MTEATLMASFSSPGEYAAEPAAGEARRPDAELIRESVSGNSRAFDQLIRNHAQHIFNYVFQMTRQSQDAEDICQQTFIKAHQHLHRADPDRPVIAWLLTIARRTALNHFRGAKHWTELSPETPSSDATPARQVEQAERTETLWDKARRLLPARDFEVLWLRIAEERSVEETAQATGLTQSNVKIIVFRARQQLMKGATHS